MSDKVAGPFCAVEWIFRFVPLCGFSQNTFSAGFPKESSDGDFWTEFLFRRMLDESTPIRMVFSFYQLCKVHGGPGKLYNTNAWRSKAVQGGMCDEYKQ